VHQFDVTLVIPRVDPLTQETLNVSDLTAFKGLNLRLARGWRGGRKSLAGRILYQGSFAAGSLWEAMEAKQPDVVLAMGAPPMSAILGLITTRIRRVPLLLDVRDIPLETAEELGIVRPVRLLRIARRLEAAVFRRADYVLCVSEDMALFVQERGVPAEKMDTNYIGYDNFEQPLNGTQSSNLEFINGLDEATKVVVFYAGTMATLVDIPTVMHAAKRLKDDRRIGFVFVGEGERKAAYEKWALTENMNVHFTGRLPKERVHELCAASDVCVYPLRGGPATGAMLGNKIFDYLGAGKPVVYTGPEGAVPRLIKRIGSGRVLPEGDDEGLAAVFNELADDPEVFTDPGEAGRKAMLDGLTAAHSADALVKQLQRMIRDHAKPCR
jgi:glycosyltransferase involved in cell wall biosynthesis